MKKTNIYIADDHNIVAEGIYSLLKRDLSIGEILIFKNGKEMFDYCYKNEPDVVLIDIQMPVWDGIKTLTEIKSKFPNINCIMISIINDKYIIENCLQRGANGYLYKDCTFEELIKAITVEKNMIYCSNEVIKTLSGLNKKQADNQIFIEPLTERELQILQLICEGLTPKEIAEKLFLSKRTIDAHKNHILKKFDVNSIGKVISLAIKNKIISI